MAGGKMMHDIHYHDGWSTHEFTSVDLRIGTFSVNSLHHQMILPPANAHVIGWSSRRLSDRYIGEADEEVEYFGPEVEAALFPTIKAFGVQYHPEIMDRAEFGYQYFHRMASFAIKKPWEEFEDRYVGPETRRVKPSSPISMCAATKRPHPDKETWDCST
jgi:hypothetical protein